VTVDASTSAKAGTVEQFHGLCVQVVGRLPFGLSSVVAPTFLGFCLINSFTFGVDLALLFVMHGRLQLPVPMAVSVAYACAFAVAYVLNRIFNFQSHASVGPQLGIYVVLVSINYLALILGLVSLLTYLGVDYRLARLMAGACEAVYMYSVMRWVVFRG
jgi:putative flippase GtrA